MKDVLKLCLTTRTITNQYYMNLIDEKFIEYNKIIEDVENPISFDIWFERNFYKETNRYKIALINKTTKEIILHKEFWKEPFSLPFDYYMDLVVAMYDRTTKESLVLDLPPLTGTVLIELHSKALGDQLAWIPIIDLFQKKHKCKVIVNIPLHKYFQPFYPNLDLQWNTDKAELQAKFVIGYDVTGVDLKRSPIDCRAQNLQHVACNQLGIEPQIVRPNYSMNGKPLIKGGKYKYVCITECSTGQFKLWNNGQGMIDVINYLTSEGYYVVILGTEHNILKKLVKQPKYIIKKTGLLHLKQLCNILEHCDFFIGLASGLAWLSHHLGKEVITVDGITQDFALFPHHKVQNKNVCNGCWNDTTLVYDNKDVNYCPRNKDFECTKQITGQMVIDVIKKL